MKGYILESAGQARWSDNVPEPKAGPLDVIIKPLVVAPCSTDVHLIRHPDMPHIVGKPLGHEVAGEIVEVGDQVKDFKVGDRVIVGSVVPNWRNPAIQEGNYKFDNISPYMVADPAFGGCFAEKCKLCDADMNIARIPDNVTLEQALMLTDMATTAFEGVDALDVPYGATIVVYGIGPVGLMAVRAAVLKGAARIIAIGSRPVCIEVAKEYGATDIVNYKDGNVVDQVMALTGGKPVDGVVVCAGGTTECIGLAMLMVKYGGTVANVSAYYGEDTLTLPNYNINYGMFDKRFQPVCARGGRLALERLLALVQYGRLAPEKLITHRFHGMEHLEEALNMMGGQARDAIKPVVYFD